MKPTYLKSLVMLAAICFGVALLDACDARTSGVKLTMNAEVVASLTNGKPVTSFTNRRDWEIQLERAYMLVGPVYLLEGEPQASLWHYLRPYGVAHAHAVNANGQRVLAELREHFVLDLLKSTPTSLGTMRGIQGIAQTAEMYLLPPGGTRLSTQSANASHVNGATIYAIGTATKNQDSRNFLLQVTLPKSDKMQLISNIGTDITLEQGNIEQGRLQMRVYIDRWFTNVDFSTLTKQDEKGRFLLTEDNNAIVQGIRSRHSYNLSWRSN